jgi:hypothetical protein
MEDENINNCEQQKNLNDFYKAALVYELELTKRDREYLINFDHVIFIFIIMIIIDFHIINQFR